MSKSIQWGFLGCGEVAHDIAADFSQVPDSSIAAVCSRTKTSAEKFARKFNIPKVYESPDAMLADPALDIVYIATPHHLHQQHAMACLQAGKAVLCEKPLTVSEQQAESLIAEARKRKLFCMEAMWMRFFPLIQDIKTRIDQGELGNIQLMHADFGYPTKFDPENRFFNAGVYGGTLLDRGIYTISLAQYLLGNPVDISSSAHIGDTGVDEHASCLLKFESGAIASLSSTLRGLSSNEAVITGSKGKLKIHDPFYRPAQFSIQQTAEPRSGSNGGWTQKIRQMPVVQTLRKTAYPLIKSIIYNNNKTATFSGNGYQFEIQEVTRCLQQGLQESPVMPLEDSLAVLRIMDTMRQQWKTRND